MMNDEFKELEKWLLSILIVCLVLVASFSIYMLVITYPAEVLIGLVILMVVAWFRFAFFE